MLQEVKKNLDKKLFLGPFPDTARFTKSGKPLFFSPIFCVLKKVLENGVERYRLILDGRGINPSLGWKNVKMIKFKPLIKFAQQCRFIWKLDMLDGFFQGPCAPEDWCFNAFCLDGLIFVSAVMLQGIANSPRNFGKIVCAFVRMLAHNWPGLFRKDEHDLINSYVDDLFCGADSYEKACAQQLFTIFVGELLGVEFHPDKMVPPRELQNVLGFVLNGENKTLEICIEKLEKFLQNCEAMLKTPKHRFFREKLIQKVLGKTIWYGRCLPELDSFASHLIACLSFFHLDRIAKGKARNRLMGRAKGAVKSIIRIVTADRAPISYKWVLHELPYFVKWEFFVDASSSWRLGGWCQEFAWQTTRQELHSALRRLCFADAGSRLNINDLEIYAFLIMELLLKVKDGMFRGWTDNKTAESAFTKMRYQQSKFGFSQKAIEFVSRKRRKYNYRVLVGWIWTKNNDRADKLSREPCTRILNNDGDYKLVQFLTSQRIFNMFKKVK